MNWEELNNCTDARLEELSEDCWKQIRQIKVIQQARKYAKGD